MNNKVKIAGVVLAGGLSTRMGEDKAQLTIKQQSLITRSVELLRSVALDEVFVSGDYPNYDCITDIHPQLGPLSGIHACVEALSEHYEALFILPVDMPLLTKDEGTFLIDKFSGLTQGVYYQDATFPMILPINQPLKDYLSETLTSRDKKQRSLYRLLTACKATPISYSTELAYRFENTNTPEQWKACLAVHQQLKNSKDI